MATISMWRTIPTSPDVLIDVANKSSMKQDKSRGKSEKITLNALVARLVANTPGEFSAAPPRLINSQPKALQQFVKVGLLLLLLLKNKTADYDIAQLGKQRIAFSPSSKF